MKIKLGDKVRCKHTGFTGIAVARTEFINGCIQWNVLPKGKDKSKMPEEICIDAQSLELVEPKPKPQQKRSGGATKVASRQRGF